MADRCRKCGEVLEDQFDACWRCGTERPGGARIETELAAGLAAGEAAADAELRGINDELAKAMERAAQEAAVTAGGRAARMAYDLTRFSEAFRRYRARADRPTQMQRPDLDRRWTHLYLAGAALVGGVAAAIFERNVLWPSWLEDRAWYLYVGGLIVVGICWHRAVEGELGDE